MATLTGPEEEVLSVMFAPDLKTVAEGSSDWTVRIWEIKSQRQQAVLIVHCCAVNSVALTHGGNVLASGRTEESIKLWDIESRTVIDTRLGHTSGITAIVYSPDNNQSYSAAMGSPVRVLDFMQE